MECKKLIFGVLIDLIRMIIIRLRGNNLVLLLGEINVIEL